MDYLVLQTHAETVGLAVSAAESHGMLCGAICASAPGAAALWRRELLSELDARDLLVQECDQALDQLARQTMAAFNDPGLGVSLLLPDDGAPLPERIAALRDWSQGFLYGLGLAGITIERLSTESAEALRDVAEIARLAADGDAGEEADEEAYAELAEFLWVAIMLVYADVQQSAEENDDGK